MMTVSGLPNNIRDCGRDPVLVSVKKNTYSMSKLAIGNPMIDAPRIATPDVKEEVRGEIRNVERCNHVYFESSLGGTNHFTTNNLIHINHNTLTTRGIGVDKDEEPAASKHSYDICVGGGGVF